MDVYHFYFNSIQFNSIQPNFDLERNNSTTHMQYDERERERERERGEQGGEQVL